MVLAMMVLANCAGKHQTAAVQKTETPYPLQEEAKTFPQTSAEMLPVPEAEPESTTIEAPEPATLSIREKKRRFFGLLRPIVESENRKILATRHRIEQLQKKRALNVTERAELRRIASAYEVTMPRHPNDTFWATMLKRVDIIPMELVLAQAANESAWGTSRFAREGNNYFGEWCFSEGCGIVPARRDDGAVHEVQAFDSPRDSVHSYLRNLNTFEAYDSLRTLRQHMRKMHKPLSARLLAVGLSQYSERGRKYVKSIRTFIRVNRRVMRTAPAIETQTAMGARITESH